MLLLCQSANSYCQLVTLVSLGFLAFPTSFFWLALYFQRIWHASALKTAVFLLPMAIMGTIVNIIAGLILHKVSNKLLMLIATAAYTAAFLIESFHKDGISYWALIFPALCLTVVGADLQFNVANVRLLLPFSRCEPLC